jgi:hypothetical protein
MFYVEVLNRQGVLYVELLLFLQYVVRLLPNLFLYMAAAGASEVPGSQALKRNSDDMAWEFAELFDPDDLQ